MMPEEVRAKYLMPKGAVQQQMSKFKNDTAVAKINVGNTTLVSGDRLKRKRQTFTQKVAMIPDRRRGLKDGEHTEISRLGKHHSCQHLHAAEHVTPQSNSRSRLQPKDFDWRHHRHAVTPVKNQGECGCGFK